jgi:hypothetical protein
VVAVSRFGDGCWGCFSELTSKSFLFISLTVMSITGTKEYGTLLSKLNATETFCVPELRPSGDPTNSGVKKIPIKRGFFMQKIAQGRASSARAQWGTTDGFKYLCTQKHQSHLPNGALVGVTTPQMRRKGATLKWSFGN